MKKPRQAPTGKSALRPKPDPHANPAAAGNPPRRRKRWFRVAAALLVPSLVLGALELALWLAGYGYPTAFFVPHPAAGPDALVENPRFAWRFMPRTVARTPEPILLTPKKPEGTCRILVFGESAALGDPAPAFGFSRILEVLLRDRHADRRFEVVNVSFTAINSHVILPIARDCRPLGADFWLVYMGNNEVIGPFGTGTVFGQQSPPLALIRAGLALKVTRTGQLLDAVMQQMWQSREAALGWGGMTMFLDRQVRRDDPRLAVLYERFQSNLREIIALGTDANARVIVSTMVSNLRDWPPFASLHRAGLTEPQQSEWNKLYQAGVAAESGADPQRAVQCYEQAAQIDDQFAELHFRWGRCCLALGQSTQAKTHFVLARDLDTLRFRTDSRLNALIRQTVAESAPQGPALLDAEQAFDQQSTNGIAGDESLYEHVHFTFAGNYLLARLFAEKVEQHLVPAPRQISPALPNWLPSEACAARLGFTDSQRYEIASLILRRFDEPIYHQQLGSTQRLARAQQAVADLRGHAKAGARRRAMEVCRQALATAPNDWVLHDLTARLLTAIDDWPAAEVEWTQVARLIPHAARPYSELGKLQQQMGKTNAAIAAFTRAIEVNPAYAEAYENLGVLYGQQGRSSDAIRLFRKALRLDPTRREAAEGLATHGLIRR